MLATIVFKRAKRLACFPINQRLQPGFIYGVHLDVTQQTDQKRLRGAEIGAMLGTTRRMFASLFNPFLDSSLGSGNPLLVTKLFHQQRPGEKNHRVRGEALQRESASVVVGIQPGLDMSEPFFAFRHASDDRLIDKFYIAFLRMRCVHCLEKIPGDVTDLANDRHLVGKILDGLACCIDGKPVHLILSFLDAFKRGIERLKFQVRFERT